MHVASPLIEGFEQLRSQPAIGGVVVGADVPIEIKVHRLRFDRHWQDLVSESVLIDNAGVALRHGHDEFGLRRDAAGGEIMLASEPYVPLQAEARQLQVLEPAAVASR